jgi:hypothetical protein
MASREEPLHYDSHRMWPDETRGPWFLKLHWDFIDNHWALTGLTIQSCVWGAEPGDAPEVARGRHNSVRLTDVDTLGRPRELTSRDLRTLRLADIVEKEGDCWQRLLVETEGAMASPARGREVVRREGPGRPPLYTEEHFAKVARAYSDAYKNRSRNPTQKVAKKFVVSRSTAAKWVARARELGFLDKTEKRVAGGVPSAQVHTVGLTAKHGPPYICFSGAGGVRCTVWVCCPPRPGLDGLAMRLSRDPGLLERVRRQGAARVLIDYFGYRLSPVESALLERFTAHETGSEFWQAVKDAGLSAEGETLERPVP